MKRILQSLCASAVLAFAVTPAYADLCDSVTGGAGASPTAATQNDVAFYMKLFPPPDPKDSTNPKKIFPSADVGNPTWNAIIVQCNRQRDTKGGQVTDVTQSTMDNAGKRQLASDDLEPKVIRGHYNFFGTPVVPVLDASITQQKYVYILSKSGRRWSMIIPYLATIHQLHEGSIDLSMGRRVVDANGTVKALTADEKKTGHAWRIYEKDQVVAAPGAPPKLTSTPHPIAETVCSTTIFRPGHEHDYDGMNGANAYKRDRDNSSIMQGKIEFRYGQDATDLLVEGCRVREVETVYVADQYGVLSPTPTTPKAFILDNFKQVAETYWTINDPSDSKKPPLFDLKLLLRGMNDQDFPKATLALLRDDDYLTANFATEFEINDREMYKSNPFAFNNFSTMTIDTTYQHEVGHAFGLDDEYAQRDGLADCRNHKYDDAFGSTNYKMCEGTTPEVRSIYHYIAASRYVTKQSECQTDPDCKKGEWCNAGPDLVLNSCQPIKADGAACALVGGGHQCQSGQCGMGRCYTTASIGMGGTCYIDGACSKGKCTGVDGLPGVCVCNRDEDCGLSGKFWCNAGLDLVKNACEPRKADGSSCDLVGGGHQCTGGSCKFARCYTPGSVAMGGTCFVDDACAKGKCSSIDGTNGTCVCQTDQDCAPVGKMWCNAGLDTKINTCNAKLAKGADCGKVGSIGNDHKCASGECSGFPDYKCK